MTEWYEYLEKRQISPRRQQVARLIARGYSNKQIAADLGVTLQTIKVYISCLFDHFGIANRTELANIVNTGSKEGK